MRFMKITQNVITIAVRAVASLRFAQRSGYSCSRRPVGGALDP